MNLCCYEEDEPISILIFWTNYEHFFLLLDTQNADGYLRTKLAGPRENTGPGVRAAFTRIPEQHRKNSLKRWYFYLKKM